MTASPAIHYTSVAHTTVDPTAVSAAFINPKDVLRLSTQGDPTLGFATEAGRGNTHNQDKLGFYRPDDVGLADMAGSIYVVADAKGPGERGIRLADRTIRQVVRAYYAAVRDYGRSDALAVAMLAADRAIREAGEASDDALGVAVAAIVICNDELIVGHVGSARAYLVRAGQTYRLTDDAADASAMLGQGPSPQPVISDGIPLGRGDRILICSDGLHQQVGEAAIASALVELPPEIGAQKLVAAAVDKGGWDDATAVVVAPFEPTLSPEPVPIVGAQDIAWSTVAIGAGTLVLLAALFMFRQELLGTLAAGVGQDGLDPTETVSQVLPSPIPSTAPVILTTTATPRPSATATEAATVSPTAPPAVKVPSVVGLTREDAEQVLRANYLEIDLIRLYSGSVAPGLIISQDPSGGVEVERGTGIQIAVSLGPAPPTATRFVPTEAPTEGPTSTATNPPAQPPSSDDDDDDEPPPPPPPPTEKPDPPTPKPDPPDPGTQGSLGPGKPGRGLAAPVGPGDFGAPLVPDAVDQGAEPSGLERLNYHRGLAGLYAVNPQTEWSEGCASHARYMVRNDAIAAEQVPGNPEYSPQGAAAAGAGLLYLSARLDRVDSDSIDDWLARPIPAAMALDPRLTVVGFGSFAEDVGTFKHGAVLDVKRGLQAEAPAGPPVPVRYPAPDQDIETVLVEWGGVNGPVPCAGFPNRTGPAVLVLLGPGHERPDVTRSSLKAGVNDLDHCVIDGSDDPALAERGAVVILPREPFRFGRNYTAVIEADGDRSTWSFRADADDNPTPTPDLPPPSPTPTPTPTFTPTFTPTPTATNTPTHTPTPTVTPSPTSTLTPTPTPTPAPAYLPLLGKEQWLLCSPPWNGIDDPEPDSPGIVRIGLELCPGASYFGRLWLEPGTDDDDWYALDVRRRASLQVSLNVPASGRGDYDLFLYRWVGGEYVEVGRSRKATGIDETIRLDGALPGRYWIRIWAFGDEVAAPYRLTWDYR